MPGTRYFPDAGLTTAPPSLVPEPSLALEDGLGKADPGLSESPF